MATRTLNGISGSGSALNFALLKQNNLSDITNAAFARNKLGLVGSLTGGNNISLAAHNGTANCTISAFGNSNSIPNTIAGYNSIGQLDIRGVVGTGFGISNFNNSALLNEKNTFLNTTTLTVNSSEVFCGIKLKNSGSTFLSMLHVLVLLKKCFYPQKPICCGVRTQQIIVIMQMEQLVILQRAALSFRIVILIAMYISL
jgi:hypothetical protein